MVTEKRRNERVAASVQVRIKRADTEITGVTMDLSLAGAQIQARADTPLRVGERVGIELDIPTLAQPLTADAEVRWVGVGQDFGLHFITGFRAMQTLALSKFLASLGGAKA